MEKMRRKGWEVTGIEYSDDAAEIARNKGLSVISAPLEEVSNPLIRYDLIVGWMVVEHLHQPLECLAKLRKWIDPKGWLVISVPDTGCLHFKLARSRWYDLHVPNHLYHFDKNTIDKMLVASGWRIERIYSQRTLASLFMSLSYIFEDFGYIGLGKMARKLAFPQGIAYYLFFPIAWIIGVLNQTGRMTVWARPAERDN